MSTNQLKPSLWAALGRPNDVTFIKLLISTNPEALIAVVGGQDRRRFFEGLPAEKRFSNRADVLLLLMDSYRAFKEHRFPRLVELCGTSDALEALVAAHVEDDLSLLVLCFRSSWNKVLARIKRLAAKAAVAELFYQCELGGTAFAVASARKAPLEVLGSMLVLGKLDPKKRNILDIADPDLALPQHSIAQEHPDPAATKLLVRHRPPALLAKTDEGALPLDYAIKFNKSPAVVALPCKLATAYKHGHFSGLIRLCGTSDELQALAVSSTEDLPLLVLCQCDSWDAASARIETSPTQETVDELHEKDEAGRAAFATAIGV